jgi:hypothetical protein
VPVRQLLRRYSPGAAKGPASGAVRTATSALALRPIVVKKDLKAIREYLHSLLRYSGSYLTDERGLDQSIICRFPVSLGEFGNAIFPHVNVDEELCGYEIKNWPPVGQKRSFTGFSEGGERGLYCCRMQPFSEVLFVVICESAIDAISYFQLYSGESTLFVSTAGTSISETQRAHLTSLLHKYHDATLLLAMDNDTHDKQGNPLTFDNRPGEKMAKLVRSLALPSHNVVRHTPTLKDWNADLLALRATGKGTSGAQ